MVGLTKVFTKGAKAAPSRNAKATEELIKRAKAGDAKARSFVKTMYDNAMSGNPQKTLRASDKAFYDPVPDAIQNKKEFQQEQGLPVESAKQIKQLNVQKSKRIADAFEQMTHNPADPKVKASYDAMIRESVAQYQKLLDSGVKFNYWRGKGEPYANSRQMADDIRNNKNLNVLATEGNFGQKNISPEELAENPLLRRTKFKDSDGNILLANDVFRAVHDYFGHGTTGTGFGAVGEEGAWAAHMKMFSPEARKALTTETRGQNSWVNFGKQLRRPDGSLPVKGDVDYISPTKRPFAEQKIGLLPEEFSMEDYVSLWKNPEFRKRAKQGGFSAATMYALTNSEESEGSLASSVLKAAIKSNDMFEGYKILKPTPENFDPRLDPRKLEQQKIKDLEVGTSESRLIDVPTKNLADFEGKRFVMGMADRTAAGDNIYEINGQKLVNPLTGEPDPVIRQGGQDYMLDPANVEEGRLWASDLSPSRQQQAVGNIDFTETGEKSLFLPFRMAQSATDHAVSTSELMIKYARQNMSKKDIKAFDKKMRDGVMINGKPVSIPDFKGLSDPESINDLSKMNSASRKAIIHVLDLDYRNAGSLNKGQARVAVTDPKQLDAQDLGFQNVGELEGGTETLSTNIDVAEGGHRTYRAGVRGEPIARLEGTMTPFDLTPEATKARGIDPENIKSQDQYTLRQSSIYGDANMPSLKRGIITEDLIRSLESQGKLEGTSYIPEDNLKKATDHINENLQNGKIDFNLLKTLGLGTGAIIGISGIMHSPDAQASLFASGVKSAVKNLQMKKATPQQFKAMLAKQKGVAGKEINAMDFDKLGNKAIGIDELNDFIDAEAPRIVMAQKRDAGDAVPLTEAEEWSNGAMQIGHDLWYSGEENLRAIDFLESVDEADYDGLRKEMFDELVNNGGMTPESANYEIDNVSTHLLNIQPSTIEKLIDKGSEWNPHWYHDKQPDYVPDMGSDGMDDVGRMEYRDYKLKGGENYREIYFNLEGEMPLEKFSAFSTLPDLHKFFKTKDEAAEYISKTVKDDPSLLSQRGSEVKESYWLHEMKAQTDAVYQGHMRDQPNNMAWARVTERTGENGERILQIEEIQSDARKNKKLKKMLPNNWREGVLNKVMETAQAEGFDGVTFSKTAKQVDEIEAWNAMAQGNNSYLISPSGERQLTDQDSALSEFMSLDEALEDAADDVEVFGNHLEKLKKRRDIDVAANILDEEQLAGMNRSIERMQQRVERATASQNKYEELKYSGWELERVSEEVLQGSEGMQRVVDQYTKEMPLMAKNITGEDVGTINIGSKGKWQAYDIDNDRDIKYFDTEAEADAYADDLVENQGIEYVSVSRKGDSDYELNYIPLKNTDGTPKKIRESKFWQAAPVAGALGYSATQSDTTQASSPSRDDVLRSQQRKAFGTIKFLQNKDIKTLEDYEAANSRGEVNPDQFKWVMDQNRQVDRVMEKQKQSTLPNEVVKKEGASVIATPQEMLRPVSEKINQDDQSLLYTPPEKMPDGAMSNADRYNKELERQSFTGRAKRLAGAGEVAMTIGSAMASESIAGLGGAGVAFMHNLADGLERQGLSDLAAQVRPKASASQVVEGLQKSSDAGIYEPRTEEGQAQLQSFGETMGELGEFLSANGGKEAMQSFEESQNWLNENVGGIFGKKAGAVAATIPRVALELL